MNPFDWIMTIIWVCSGLLAIVLIGIIVSEFRESE